MIEKIVSDFRDNLDDNHKFYNDIDRLLSGIYNVNLDSLESELIAMVDLNLPIANYLKLSNNNKLKELGINLNICQCHVIGIDLLSGYTCAMASLCKSYASKQGKTRTLKHGDDNEFNCYSAMHEVAFTNAYLLRKYNTQLIAKIQHDILAIAYLILQTLNKAKRIKVVRFQTAGDFVTYEYFIAMILVAQVRKDLVFFGYTKNLPYVKISQLIASDNFKLVYSFGGKMDTLITDEPVAYVVVKLNEVKSNDEVVYHKLDNGQIIPVACIHATDTGDYEYILSQISFGLMLH